MCFTSVFSILSSGSVFNSDITCLGILKLFIWNMPAYHPNIRKQMNELIKILEDLASADYSPMKGGQKECVTVYPSAN